MSRELYSFDELRLKKHVEELDRLVQVPDSHPNLRLNRASTWFLLKLHDEAKSGYISIIKEYIASGVPHLANSVCESVLKIYPNNKTIKKLSTVSRMLSKVSSDPLKLYNIQQQFDFSGEEFFLAAHFNEKNSSGIIDSSEKSISENSDGLKSDIIADPELDTLFKILEKAPEIDVMSSSEPEDGDTKPVMEISIDLESEEDLVDSGYQMASEVETREVKGKKKTLPLGDANPPQ